MTIHPEHPFLPPEQARDAARRFRGRLIAPVTLWLARGPRGPVGLTVSSVLLALGEPPLVLGLLDPDSALAEALVPGAAFTVSILGGHDQRLADAFAGVAPAPGGPFRLAETVDELQGPRLADRSWLGARVTDARASGWSTLVTAQVERVEVVDATVLAHLRGRYRLMEP